MQETVIASFFWGYMMLQLPAGQLAHRFGAKYLLTGALIVNSVISILLPTATYYVSHVLLQFLMSVFRFCHLLSFSSDLISYFNS